jgi:hypothetical protein
MGTSGVDAIARRTAEQQHDAAERYAEPKRCAHGASAAWLGSASPVLRNGSFWSGGTHVDRVDEGLMTTTEGLCQRFSGAITAL